MLDINVDISPRYSNYYYISIYKNNKIIFWFYNSGCTELEIYLFQEDILYIVMA